MFENISEGHGGPLFIEEREKLVQCTKMHAIMQVWANSANSIGRFRTCGGQ